MANDETVNSAVGVARALVDRERQRAEQAAATPEPHLTLLRLSQAFITHGSGIYNLNLEDIRSIREDLADPRIVQSFIVFSRPLSEVAIMLDVFKKYYCDPPTKAALMQYVQRYAQNATEADIESIMYDVITEYECWLDANNNDDKLPEGLGEE